MTADRGSLDTRVPDILSSVGIQPGAVVLMHSSLWVFGTRAFGDLRGRARPTNLVDALLEYLTPAGTLVVPTFTYQTAKSGSFDRRATPSEGMGVLAEAVRQHAAARRSPHPLQSIAAVGAHAADLCGLDTAGAFNLGGPFDRLLQLDGQLLFLGAPFDAASLVHYAEERCEVPYRSWKTFDIPCVTDDGIVVKPYGMFVRSLAEDPQLHLEPIRNVLEEQSALAHAAVGSAEVKACASRAFVTAAMSLLRQNPRALLRPAPAHAGASRQPS